MDKRIVKDMGNLSEEAYNSYSKTDYIKKLPQYTVIDTDTQPSGFQGMLLKTGDKYVFAFRGTEFPGQFMKDLIITDIAYMGTGRVPQQMKDAMSFIEEMKKKEKGKIKTSNTTITGHSLGGSIAGMASYVYGFQAFTYNGFGIKNMLWDANDTYVTDIPIIQDPLQLELIVQYHSLGEHLEDLGVQNQKSTENITNIIQIGHARDDLVGGIATNILSGQVGQTHFVLNHTGAPGGEPNNTHSIEVFNQSISIYNNLLEIIPDEDYNSLTKKLLYILPNEESAELTNIYGPDKNKVERFLNILGELTGVGETTSENDHEPFSERLKNSGISNLSLIAHETQSKIDNLDKEQKADLYALLRLMPFTIEGKSSLYDQFSELEVDYTDQFITDRGLFIVQGANKNGNQEPIKFSDKELNITLERGGSNGQTTQHFIFGDSGNNTYGTYSNQGDDHLYGMDGNDTLFGHGGEDYLEGGSGSDKLYGGDGDDDIIGGKGPDELHGGDNNDTFFIMGEDSAYDDFWGGDGHDTIEGSDEDDIIRVNQLDKTNSIEVIDGKGKENTIAGTNDDNIIDLSETTLVSIESIHGEGGQDTITGSSDADIIYGGLSSDIIDGKEGNDTLYGILHSDGDDFATDRLEGGEGDDTYYIGIGDVISDVDKEGTVYLGDKKLPALTLKQQGNNINFYQDEDQTYSAVLNNDGSLNIFRKADNFFFTLDSFSSKDFGITLENWEEEEKEYDYSFSGLDIEGNVYRGKYYSGNESFGAWFTFHGDERRSVTAEYRHVIVYDSGWLFSGDEHGSSIWLKRKSDPPTFSISSKDGDDAISGLSNSDFFDGGPGNDFILGQSISYVDAKETIPFFSEPEETGGDILYGGAGIDFIKGSEGDDTIDGNSDNDFLAGFKGDDIISGGEGTDVLAGGYDNDILYGMEDMDFLFGDGYLSEIDQHGNELNGGFKKSVFFDLDQLPSLDIQPVFSPKGYITDYKSNFPITTVSEGNDDFLSGGAGVDYLEGNGGNDILNGNEDEDTLIGGLDNDLLFGGNKNDLLVGDNGDGSGDGADVLFGGEGDDDLYGLGGADILIGESGIDNLYGNDGDDILSGGEDDDVLFGDNEDKSGSGNDFLYGGPGNDELQGHGGDDVLYGQTGDDMLFGYGDDDQLFGGQGQDQLIGGDGEDALDGNEGDDLLFGGKGNDTLAGSRGNDSLQGEAGDDTYVFSFGDGTDYLIDTQGNNSIHFNTITDISQLSVYYATTSGGQVARNEDGADLWIEYSADDRVIIKGGKSNFSFQYNLADGSRYGHDAVLSQVVMQEGNNSDSTDESPSPGSETSDSNQRQLSIEEIYHTLFPEENTSENNIDIYSRWDLDIARLVTDYSSGSTTSGGGSSNSQNKGEIKNPVELYYPPRTPGSSGDIDEYKINEINRIINGFGSFDNGAISYDHYWQLREKEKIPSTVSSNFTSSVTFNRNRGKTVTGGPGNDQLSGSPEDDYIYGESGDDVIKGLGSDDTLDGGIGTDTLYGGEGDDYLVSWGGNDVLHGGDGNDNLNGGSFSFRDTLLIGGPGSDFLTGGTADYSDSSSAVTINLDYGSAEGGDAEGDEFEEIVGVIGSKYNDYVYGFSNFSNSLEGGEGNDYLEGGNENDFLCGGTGSNILHGRGGNDTYLLLIDGNDENVINDDHIFDTGGFDRVVFSSNVGSEEVSFTLKNEGLLVRYGKQLQHSLMASRYCIESFQLIDGTTLPIRLSEDSHGEDNDDNNSSHSQIDEKLILKGSDSDDELHGNSGDNYIDGGYGSNRLFGGHGDDTYLLSSDVEDGLYDDDYIAEDYIYDEGGNDSVIFNNSLNWEDIQFELEDEDLHVRYGEELQHSLFVEGNSVETFKIEGGGVKSREDIIQSLTDDGGEDGYDDDLGSYDDDTGGYEKYISGTDGDDILRGDDSDDYLNAKRGNDLIEAGAGDDMLEGGEGQDQLFGNSGDDYLNAEDGDDQLDGGYGSNILAGGRGNDHYYLSADDEASLYDDDLIVNDYLYDDDGNDCVVFNRDIDWENISFELEDEDLHVRYGKELQHYLLIAGNSVETFKIQGGTTKSPEEIIQSLADDGGEDGYDDDGYDDDDAADPLLLQVANYEKSLDEDSDIDGQIEVENGGDEPGFSIWQEAASGEFDLEDDGSWYYTPDENFNGSDQVKVKIKNDAGGEAISTIDLTIKPVNDAPVIEPVEQYHLQDIRSYEGQLVAHDIDGDELSYSIVGEPPVGNLRIKENGSWEYEAAEGFIGNDKVIVLVEDGNGGNKEVDLSFYVQVSPPLVKKDSVVLNEDSIFSGNLSVENSVGGRLTFSIDDDSEYGVFQIDEEGWYTYKPLNDFNGEDRVSLTVRNKYWMPAEATILFSVLPVNDLPVIRIPEKNILQDVRLATGQLEASDIDEDNLSFTITGEQPSGTFAVEADGSWSYEAARGFVGEDKATVLVEDDKGGSRSIDLLFEVMVSKPSLKKNELSLDEDSRLESRLEVDNPVGGTLTYSINKDSEFGEFQLDEDGKFSYKPKENFFGSDAVLITIANEYSLSTKATLSITVLPVNDTPEAPERLTTVLQDTVVATGTVPATDVDGDTVTFTISVGPENGTLTIDENGNWRYETGEEYAGDEFAVITIDDGKGGITTTTLTFSNVKSESSQDEQITEQVILKMASVLPQKTAGPVQQTNVENNNAEKLQTSSSGKQSTETSTPTEKDKQETPANTSILKKYLETHDIQQRILQLTPSEGFKRPWQNNRKSLDLLREIPIKSGVSKIQSGKGKSEEKEAGSLLAQLTKNRATSQMESSTGSSTISIVNNHYDNYRRQTDSISLQSNLSVQSSLTGFLGTSADRESELKNALLTV